MADVNQQGAAAAAEGAAPAGADPAAGRVLTADEHLVRRAASVALKRSDPNFLHIVWAPKLHQYPECIALWRMVNSNAQQSVFHDNNQFCYQLARQILSQSDWQDNRSENDAGSKDNAAPKNDATALANEIKKASLALKEQRIQAGVLTLLEGITGYYDKQDRYVAIDAQAEGLAPELQAQRRADRAAYITLLQERIDDNFDYCIDELLSTLYKTKKVGPFATILDELIAPERVSAENHANLSKIKHATHALMTLFERAHQIHEQRRYEQLGQWLSHNARQPSEVYNVLSGDVGIEDPDALRERLFSLLVKHPIWRRDCVNTDTGDTLLHEAMRKGAERSLLSLLCDAPTLFLANPHVEVALLREISRAVDSFEAIVGLDHSHSKRLQTYLTRCINDDLFERSVPNKRGLKFHEVPSPQGNLTIHYLVKNNRHVRAMQLAHSMQTVYFQHKNEQGQTAFEVRDRDGHTLPVIALRFDDTELVLKIALISKRLLGHGSSHQLIERPKIKLPKELQVHGGSNLSSLLDAVAVSVPDPQLDAESLRQTLIEHLVLNRAAYLELFDLTSEDYDLNLVHLQKNSWWGGQLEIHALQEVLQRLIVVGIDGEWVCKRTEELPNPPLFIYYFPEMERYECLTVSQSYSASVIFNRLTEAGQLKTQLTPSSQPSSVWSYLTMYTQVGDERLHCPLNEQLRDKLIRLISEERLDQRHEMSFLARRALADQDHELLRILWAPKIQQCREYLALHGLLSEYVEPFNYLDQSLAYVVRVSEIMDQYIEESKDFVLRTPAEVSRLAEKLRMEIDTYRTNIVVWRMNYETEVAEGEYDKQANQFRCINADIGYLTRSQKFERRINLDRYRSHLYDQIERHFEVTFRQISACLSVRKNYKSIRADLKQLAKDIRSRYNTITKIKTVLGAVVNEFDNHYNDVARNAHDQCIRAWLSKNAVAPTPAYLALRNMVLDSNYGAARFGNALHIIQNSSAMRYAMSAVLKEQTIWHSDIVDAQSGDTLLHVAMKEGREEAVVRMLSRQPLMLSLMQEEHTCFSFGRSLAEDNPGKQTLLDQVANHASESSKRFEAKLNRILDAVNDAPGHEDAPDRQDAPGHEDAPGRKNGPTFYDQLRALLIDEALSGQVDFGQLNYDHLPFHEITASGTNDLAVHYLIRNDRHSLAMRLAYCMRPRFYKMENQRGETLLTTVDSEGRTLPIYALRCGDIDLVSQFLTADALGFRNADDESASGSPALMIGGDEVRQDHILPRTELPVGLEFSRVRRSSGLFDAIVAANGDDLGPDGKPVDVNWLRRNVIKHLKAEQSRYMAQFNLTHEDYNHNLAQLRKNSWWGGQLEIAAAQIVMQRPIIMGVGHTWVYRQEEALSRPPLFIYYFPNSERYDGVVASAGLGQADMLEVIRRNHQISSTLSAPHQQVSVTSYLTACFEEDDTNYVYPMPEEARSLLLEFVTRQLNSGHSRQLASCVMQYRELRNKALRDAQKSLNAASQGRSLSRDQEQNAIWLANDEMKHILEKTYFSSLPEEERRRKAAKMLTSEILDIYQQLELIEEGEKPNFLVHSHFQLDAGERVAAAKVYFDRANSSFFSRLWNYNCLTKEGAMRTYAKSQEVVTEIERKIVTSFLRSNDTPLYRVLSDLKDRDGINSRARERLEYMTRRAKNEPGYAFRVFEEPDPTQEQNPIEPQGRFVSRGAGAR